MSRRLIAWLVTLPLAVAGTELAHAIAYRITTPAAGERAHELSSTGHGYAAYLPLALALGAVLVVFALSAEIWHATAPGRSPSRPRAWHFAVFAPALFACQEHFERLLVTGSFPFDTALAASFVAGLLLQLPFALAAYALVRLLLRAARTVGEVLARRRRQRLSSATRSRPRSRLTTPRLPALALGYGSRGPPSASG